MAIITSKVIRLVFNTSGGSTFAVTIPQPQATIGASEARSVADAVVAANIFVTSSGELTGVRDIKIIDTTTEDLFDPPQA